MTYYWKQKLLNLGHPDLLKDIKHYIIKQQKIKPFTEVCTCDINKRNINHFNLTTQLRNVEAGFRLSSFSYGPCFLPIKTDLMVRTCFHSSLCPVAENSVSVFSIILFFIFGIVFPFTALLKIRFFS